MQMRKPKERIENIVKVITTLMNMPDYEMSLPDKIDAKDLNRLVKTFEETENIFQRIKESTEAFINKLEKDRNHFLTKD